MTDWLISKTLRCCQKTELIACEKLYILLTEHMKIQVDSLYFLLLASHQYKLDNAPHSDNRSGSSLHVFH